MTTSKSLQDTNETRPQHESVWDYPRPPRLEPTSKHIQVFFKGTAIADSTRALRILETSHAPAFYIPPDDVRMEFLEPNVRSTFCEWKGEASYYDVVVGDWRAVHAAWTYKHPTDAYAELQDYLAFYPSPMDACLVDGERAHPESPSFYGGWVTRDIRTARD